MAPPGYNLHLYATDVGTGVPQDGLASAIVPQDGYLVTANIDIDGRLVAEGDSVWGELSFSNSFRSNVNDQNSTILSCRGRFNVVGAAAGADVGRGVTLSFNNKMIPGIPVQAGDKLYLNAEVTDTRNFHIMADIFLVAGRIKETSRARSR